MERRIAILAATAVSLVVAAGSYAGSRSFAPGATDPQEQIVARRILMSTIGSNNDWVHTFLDGEVPWNEREVFLRLESIAGMMRAFGHLFDPATDNWSPELEAGDPARVSYALPAVWENWSDFMARVELATNLASDAAFGGHDRDIFTLVAELEVQCEGCHALYRRPFEFVSFDDVLGPAVPDGR